MDLRRLVFELDLKYILFFTDPTKKRAKRLELEEFKQSYEREYDLLRNHLLDDDLHGRFTELKDKVNEMCRKVNKIETREDLLKVQEEVAKECPMIDF